MAMTMTGRVSQMVFLFLLTVHLIAGSKLKLPEGVVCSEPTNAEGVVPRSMVDTMQAQIDSLLLRIDEIADKLSSPGSITNPGLNCKAIHYSALARGEVPTSGVYYIRPNASEPYIQAYCDASEESGWTLILNYWHKSGTSPPSTFHNASLPLFSHRSLGFDGSTVGSEWGQATTSMLSKIDFKELRFYCKGTTAVESIHFSTPDVSYAKTGLGSFSSMASSYTALTGHYQSLLPGTKSNGYSNQGNLSVSNFPFYDGSRHYQVGVHNDMVSYFYACNTLHGTYDGNMHFMVFVR